MNDARDIGDALAELLLAYEQLGAQRRRELGLGPNEEVVLLFLGKGVDAPTELSRAVGMTTAGMTNLLDRLEHDGYIRRERHRADKRRVLVTLTKQGFRAYLQFDAVNGELDEVVRHYEPAERAAIRRFLAEATEHVRARANPPAPQ